MIYLECSAYLFGMKINILILTIVYLFEMNLNVADAIFRQIKVQITALRHMVMITALEAVIIFQSFLA